MKKYLFVLLAVIVIAFPNVSFAWDDCPYGETDCSGLCNRYIDTDGNEICDKSELAPEDRINEELIVLVEPELILEAELLEEIQIDDLQEEENEKKEEKDRGMIYHLWPITAFLIGLYLLTWVLMKKKIIQFINHRRFWNLLLLLTVLVSGLLGVLLIFRINSGVITPMPFNILYWHVEFGIAMFIISIFHTLWHWNYFKIMFVRRKK